MCECIKAMWPCCFNGSDKVPPGMPPKRYIAEVNQGLDEDESLRRLKKVETLIRQAGGKVIVSDYRRFEVTFEFNPNRIVEISVSPFVKDVRLAMLASEGYVAKILEAFDKDETLERLKKVERKISEAGGKVKVSNFGTWEIKFEFDPSRINIIKHD